LLENYINSLHKNNLADVNEDSAAYIKISLDFLVKEVIFDERMKTIIATYLNNNFVKKRVKSEINISITKDRNIQVVSNSGNDKDNNSLEFNGSWCRHIIKLQKDIKMNIDYPKVEICDYELCGEEIVKNKIFNDKNKIYIEVSGSTDGVKWEKEEPVQTPLNQSQEHSCDALEKLALEVVDPSVEIIKVVSPVVKNKVNSNQLVFFE